MSDQDRPGWYSPLYGLSDKDISAVPPHAQRLLGVGGAMGLSGTLALAAGQGLGVKPLEYGGAALTAASLVPLSMGLYSASKEAEDHSRPVIPSSPYFHGGTALLAAAPVMGISMPRAMQAKADVAQKIVDRASMDGLRLQRGIAELEEAASPGLEELAARLSRRAEAGTRMRDKALRQLATEGKILKGMGVGAGVLGAGLTAKGLYDHFQKEAAVPRAKKEYRRALQMLLEGQHAFHGTTQEGAKAILEHGAVKPGSRGIFSHGVPEVYMGNKMPAAGWAPEAGGTTFAVPRAQILAGPRGAGTAPRVHRADDWMPGPGQADTWLLTPNEVPLSGATMISDVAAPLEVRKALRLRHISNEPYYAALEAVYPGAVGTAQSAAATPLLGRPASPEWVAGAAARDLAHAESARRIAEAPGMTFADRYARIVPDYAESGQVGALKKELESSRAMVNPTRAADLVAQAEALQVAMPLSKSAGASQALSDLGLTKTALGMTLRFNSPEEAQEHMRNRNIIGALGGGLLGGYAGGRFGGSRFGVPGAVVGGVAGAALGSIPGRLLADVAHDYRERTTSTYNDTMQRLNAAGGGNIRVASAPLYKSAGMVQLEHEEPPQELLDMAAREGHPLSASHVTVYGDGEPIGFMGAHDAKTLYVRPDFRDLGYESRAISHFNYDMQRKRASALDEFIQFTDQDAKARQEPGSNLENASGYQLDQEKRERPPGFGPPSSLSGADAGTRMMQIGLPGSGAT